MTYSPRYFVALPLCHHYIIMLMSLCHPHHGVLITSYHYHDVSITSSNIVMSLLQRDNNIILLGHVTVMRYTLMTYSPRYFVALPLCHHYIIMLMSLCHPHHGVLITSYHYHDVSITSSNIVMSLLQRDNDIILLCHVTVMRYTLMTYSPRYFVALPLCHHYITA